MTVESNKFTYFSEKGWNSLDFVLFPEQEGQGRALVQAVAGMFARGEVFPLRLPKTEQAYGEYMQTTPADRIMNEIGNKMGGATLAWVENKFPYDALLQTMLELYGYQDHRLVTPIHQVLWENNGAVLGLGSLREMVAWQFPNLVCGLFVVHPLDKRSLPD